MLRGIQTPVGRGTHEVTSLISWGAAVRACSGESESGDAFLIKSVPQGTLIAVADGLGHGAVAAKAAYTALTLAGSHATEPLSEIARLCHLALHGTRGASLTLARIDGVSRALTWLGVGSIAGTLLHASINSYVHESLLLRGGVLGQRIAAVTSVSLPLLPGDTLVLVTNGVRWYPVGGSPERAVIAREDPDAAARRLLEENAILDDDALAVVARYRG